MQKMKPIDMGAFKGLLNDLDEIGFALAVDRPGQEAIGLAMKAVDRLGAFLDTVPEPTLGLHGHVADIRRGLSKCGREGLFSGPPKLDSARESHQYLRKYIEGLRLAWAVCLIAPGRAEEAAGQRLAW